MRKYQKTFGPVVVQPEGTDEFTAKCYSGRFDCKFRIGGTCTFVRPGRKIPELPATPDWCEMKESALKDARDMAEGGA
ncbi:hypothetical protein [Roseicyclus sp.]|uniref:hypothetical protein n=1 Tax=Roseicyclus sp. TaxID=1914329 RepID=UPI003F6D2D8B